jgi:hypothetical protein
MKKLLFLGIIFCLFAFSATAREYEACYNQDTLNLVDAETITLQTLGFNYPTRDMMITDMFVYFEYNMLDFEYLPDAEAYCAYYKNYKPYVSYERYQWCIYSYGVNQCNNWFWQSVINNILFNLEAVQNKVVYYQAGINDDYMGDNDGGFQG